MNGRLSLSLSLYGLVAIVPARAMAACPTWCDGDGDGYSTPPVCGGCPAEPDCDDADAAISPAAAEDPSDFVDDDCDGSTLIHRAFVTALEGPSIGPNGPFIGVRASGAVLLDPIGSGALQKARLTNRWPIPWQQGLSHLYVMVDDITSANCNVSVAGSGFLGSSSVLSEGLNLVTFSLTEGGQLTTLVVECSGTGSAEFDWIVLQNGAFEWPPFQDLAGSTEDMSLSGNGYLGFVRASDNQDVFFIGADQGGLAWSEDGVTWVGANGDAFDWQDSYRMGVWDAWSPDGTELYTINGQKDDATGGGVFHSQDRGITYDKVGDNDADGVPDMNLWTSRRFSDCSAGVGNTIASGRLLVNDPDHDFLYVGVGGPAVETAMLEDPVGDRGVWVVDRASGYTWRAFDNDAPAGDGLPGWTCTEDLAGSGECTGIVSALALGTVSSGIGVDQVVIVGYRANIYTDATDRTTLYVCRRVDATDAVGSCVPVDTEIDVRDIEPVPGTSNEFLVVDGGVRYDPEGDPNACSQAEASVYYLVVDEIKTEAGAGSDIIQIFDTDDTSLSTPAWDPDYWDDANEWDGLDSPHCTWPSVGATGNLVPPKGLMEIPGIAVDDREEKVVAFYNSGSENTDYDCVRWFRADIADLYAGAASWEPMQEIGGIEETTAMNRGERVGAMSLGGAWFRDEPLPETVLTGGTDATFVYDDDPPIAGDLLFAHAGPVWVFREETGYTGWNSDSSTKDLDEMRVYSGEVEGFPMLQSTCAEVLSTCPDCAGGGDDVVGYAVGDQGGGDAYTHASGVTREPATHMCELSASGRGSTDVDFWSEAGAWQRWQLQSASEMPTGENPYGFAQRVLVFSEGVEGDTTFECFQGLYPYTNFKKGDGVEEPITMTCYDGETSTGIPACGDGGAYGLKLASGVGIGSMVAVEAYDENRALVLALDTCNTVDDFGNCTATGGLGLYLAEFDPTSEQITWTSIPYDLTAPTCELADAVGTLSQLDIDEAGYARTGILRAFLDGEVGDCPVLSVDVDPASPETPTWAEWDHDVTNRCRNNPADSGSLASQDIALSADGNVLLISGGMAAPGDWNLGGICAVTVGGIDADPTVESVDSANYEVAVSQYDLSQQTKALAAHPFLDDLWAFSVAGRADCAVCTKPDGLYLLQHRYDGYVGDWVWGFRRVADAGSGLEGPALLDVAWGSPDPWPSADRLFAAGNCSGLREVSLTW